MSIKSMHSPGAVVSKDVIDLCAPKARSNGIDARATGQQSPAADGRQCWAARFRMGALMLSEADRAWLLKDFQETKRKIQRAKEYQDSMDEARRQAEQKIRVVQSCESCAYLFRRDNLCVNYSPPIGLRWTAKPGDVLAISPSLAETIHCREWDDLDLKLLLAMDPRPSSVAYYRRHPEVVAPLKGRLLLGLVLIIRRILNGHPGYVHRTSNAGGD